MVYVAYGDLMVVLYSWVQEAVWDGDAGVGGWVWWVRKAGEGFWVCGCVYV